MRVDVERDHTGAIGYVAYEFNRAICNIESSLAGQPKDRETILNDLKRAAESRRWREVIFKALRPGKEPMDSLAKWLAANTVTKKDFE